jgi:cyclopropane fatty-acyl-phospholipid synthase-like methyltransferase
MGPSSCRTIEELTLDLDVKKGSRIIDLGYGKALTSVYLAMKEVDSDDNS